MIGYHKIESIYKRDPETKFKTFLDGKYSRYEFEMLKDAPWHVTEKIDGMNIRVGWDGWTVAFGGCTDRAILPGDLVEKLHERFTPEVLEAVFPDYLGAEQTVTFFGEGFGAGIQKGGGNYSEKKDFILFDILHNDTTWMAQEDVTLIAQTLNLPRAPVIGITNLSYPIELAQHGFQSTFGEFEAEGFIMRPKFELTDRRGRRVITKVKCKDFPKIDGRKIDMDLLEHVRAEK